MGSLSIFLNNLAVSSHIWRSSPSSLYSLKDCLSRFFRNVRQDFFEVSPQSCFYTSVEVLRTIVTWKSLSSPRPRQTAHWNSYGNAAACDQLHFLLYLFKFTCYIEYILSSFWITWQLAISASKNFPWYEWWKKISLSNVTSLISRDTYKESQNALMTKTYSVGFSHEAELMS